jgi:nicotinamidase-related amidase
MNGTHGQHSELVAGAIPYLHFLESWLQSLQPAICEPQRTAVLVVDMVEGFCEHGALASSRVQRLEQPVAVLLETYGRAGGNRVWLLEDAHAEASREFRSFPPHCLIGSTEARTVAQLRALETPAWRHFAKQTLNRLAEPEVRSALDAALRSGTLDFVIVGNCTDLCIYQVAMALQLLLNRTEYASYTQARVLVASGAVDTYDLPPEAAAGGAQPHPADLLHAVFLHHMELNGVIVAREIIWQGGS